MDSSISEHHHHHHRKRKRSRHLYHSSYSFFSVRSLILCFSFLLFLYLLSYRVHLAPVDFRPVLVVPGFPLFSSSSSSSSNSIQLFSGAKQPSFLVEDRVFFPDHVLLLVSRMSRRADELDCVYYPNRSGNSGSGDAFDGFTFTSVNRNALSVDEYNEFQSIVRCPLPPENYSAAAVNLKPRRRRRWIGGEKAKTEVLRGNQTLRSWEMVAYAAVLDGNTTVVFVKGLNLRADRESDPTPFTCHFGLGNWERDGRGYVLTTKAITAAQEVVRCSLPASIRMNPSKAQGIRVTIGITPQVHAKAHSRLLVPSVAKIFGTGEELRKKREMSKGKYELCVCTMVWNQASALREWVVYHAWLGIERWFIYDNNSDDGIQEVINELNRGNYNVSRQVWPWIKTQEAGFSHCALRARDECNWVGFMDVDEFFYFAFPTPRSHRFGTLGFPDQNALRNLLTNFSSSTTIAEIRTACHSFGPSGLSSPPSQGVTVGYTCRLQSPERHKSIVRPDALDTTLLNVVHHFHLKKGFTYLNLPQSTVVINHYKYQVWESFRTKFYRRVATYVADWQENQNEGSRDRAPGLGTEPIEPPNWRLQFCEVWDTGMRDFVLANLADPATGLLPWERTSL
ncbi:glycosyltransferase family 92 protein RCOM_0530710 [Diospyros lotus]|uniref:glycosyltransferase family 92 protein RCOM_0530710 n=1 Tax=Diospyros lotus TaxID=55363 RepID=UPI002259531A|nr:glycosyltransferase family 92 protein RCOM_0530710 [Diospyros lotus]